MAQTDKKKNRVSWKDATGLGVGTLFLVSYMFGFEPQILRPPTDKCVADMSFGDYYTSSIKQNGDSVLTKAVTVIAFPGAVAGNVISNIGCNH